MLGVAVGDGGKTGESAVEADGELEIEDLVVVAQISEDMMDEVMRIWT